MPSQTVKLVNPTGLHARPAKVFAEAAAKTGLTVKVTKGDNTVNARSVLSVLTLDCHHGDEITISVDGEDEAAATAALAQLVELVETGIGEHLAGGAT
ncbi:MAG: HPr family phosphocarrier protein [Acidimicrobiales bacterium]